MSYDFNRPFCNVAEMDTYTAVDDEVAARYGRHVKAIPITNREYTYRYRKFSPTITMRPPPGSVMKIFPGYLTVRNLGKPNQYETWIPDSAIEEMYVIEASSASD